MQPPSHPPIPTLPVAHLLPDGIGYLVVPGCSSADVAGLREYARVLRRSIEDLLGSPSLRGIVIDLRLNGGGNVWPMLVGLRPLLGDGVAATSVINGEVRMRFGCDGDSAWLSGPTDADRKEQLRIDPSDDETAMRPVPIAVLVHSWTMSSGEMIAGALRDRAGGRLFGEPTAGLTTAVYTAVLIDGSQLSYPTHVMAGPTGRPLGERVMPDQTVRSDGWPSDDDPVAKAAIEWVLSQR